MYQLSCPSKTFIIGEYAVLDGGHGVVVGTGPRFEMRFKEVDEGEESFIKGLSPQGPPMDYLKKHLDFYSDLQIELFDPHEHRGGFGWSSAQFLFLYVLKHWVEEGKKEVLPTISREKLLECFLEYSWNGDGWAPSGLDILSQYDGGLLFLQSPRKVVDGQLEPIEFGDYHRLENWPFDEIQFCLMRTGNKIATHSHLSNLQHIGTASLAKIAHDVGQSLLAKDEEEFIAGINNFREDLREQDLVDPSSWHTQQDLLQRPEVLAVKGCGALGADVLLLVLVDELMDDFLEWAEEEDYMVIGDSRNIHEGLHFSEWIEDGEDEN